MRSTVVWLCVTVSLIVCGCTAPNANDSPDSNGSSPVRVRGVSLEELTAPVPFSEPVALAAAKNEWVSYTLQLDGLPLVRTGKRPPTLRLGAMNLTSKNAQISPANAQAFQVLGMPVDAGRAGYVRHTGQTAANRVVPRALLPLPILDGGRVDLSKARDPDNPTDPRSRALSSKQPILIWIDLHVPHDAPHGSYEQTLDLLDGDNAKTVTRARVNLTVRDFVLPDARHLAMVAPLEWDDLSRLYRDRFEAVTPRLMNRSDPRYAEAIKTLDQLVTLAQDNRAQVIVPRLQPTVKWPPGRPPQVDWVDYTSVVTPWLRGDGFRDRQPVSYWPLPMTDNLANYDQRSQLDYLLEAAKYFDQSDWLPRAPVVLRSTVPGRVSSDEALKLSGDAAQVLALNPRLRVEVPLEDDQVHFAGEGNQGLIRLDTANRLITANPGLVFASPVQSWPSDVPRPARWLRTDLGGVIPYVGAGGGERDVRLWAWFASVPLPPPPLGIQYGAVQYIRWPGALPKQDKPTDPADPNEMVWFYPGSWFGIDQPVPTLQLKWLRRAQQDFEYIYLARQRGETINALVMARLLSKPVELQPNQQPDPTYGLMSGAADARAWNEALDLLARRILLREPGVPLDLKRDNELNLELLRWALPEERPVAMGRTVTWFLDTAPRTGGAPAGPRIDVRLGIDIYNAADRMPDRNTLEFSGVPSGWHHRPQPTFIDQLGTYHVRRFAMGATVEPIEVRNTDRKPVEITFTDGFTNKKSKMAMVLPVAASERREGRLHIDGSLEDWAPEDAVQDGPLVRMFDRPSLHKQELPLASTPTNLFTTWAEENVYVAFKVSGVNSGESRAVRNFVDYQFDRAWGEDLVQILIQPVYSDNTLGPVFHAVCKPNGHWVERKLDPRRFAEPWQAFEGTGIRYAATIDGPDWRGEVAIPWRALSLADEAKKGRPVMLRFNFSQHKHLTGESSTWAGPVDFGRDERFMGVLLIREPNNPGMRN
jgi:hypothetical protein